MFLSDKKLNLVIAGGIDRYHNTPIWIEVMKHLKNDDIHLTIAGSGNGVEEVQYAIERSQLKNITLIGEYFTQKELAKYIRSADYALTSMNNQFEVLYDVVLTTKAYEALSCGTPVISIMGKGMNDFVKEFPPSVNFNLTSGIDAGFIAREIKKLPILGENERDKLSNRFQSRYSYQVLSKKFKEVLSLSIKEFGEYPLNR